MDYTFTEKKRIRKDFGKRPPILLTGRQERKRPPGNRIAGGFWFSFPYC